MPCYSPEPTAQDYYVTFEHNSPLADMMCRLLLRMEGEKLFPSDADIQQWWRVHKKRDAAKKVKEEAIAKAEAEREAALAKLSPAERKLFGL